jgi:hypothetical protein
MNWELGRLVHLVELAQPKQAAIDFSQYDSIRIAPWLRLPRFPVGRGLARLAAKRRKWSVPLHSTWFPLWIHVIRIIVEVVAAS